MEQDVVRKVEVARSAPRGYRATLRGMSKVFLGDRRAGVGGVILLIAMLLTLIGGYITPFDPDEPNTDIRFTGPNLQNWMGTDHIGRDVMSRILAGLKVSMLIAAGAVAISVAVGLPIGAFSGYVGGKVDVVIMRIMDAIIAFPSRLLAIALVAATGASIINLWFAIAFSAVPGYARILRAQVLGQKEREYVEAARMIGENPANILFRYIVPNSMTPVMVRITLNFSHAIMVESSLSFLGLGLVPPTISWGQMLNASQEYMEIAWWTAVFPGAALSILILGFFLVGDALRDHLDPRKEGRRRRGRR